ncbi:MAG TPA: hypothetical protein VHD32_11865 [Candidatus Didemnitutus sp.]|nr:hypothetical protein [Candidatus Didemnitutus sp.]
MKNKYGVDLELVIANAVTEGIDLSEITLFYSEVTATEIAQLSRKNLFVANSNARTIGRFDSEGRALFPEKVSEVYCLGA